MLTNMSVANVLLLEGDMGTQGGGIISRLKSVWDLAQNKEIT